jgi:hypothetical protein
MENAFKEDDKNLCIAFYVYFYAFGEENNKMRKEHKFLFSLNITPIFSLIYFQPN